MNPQVPQNEVTAIMSDYTDPHGGNEALRASDSERDAAVNLLAAHYADGRLDRAEFDERADVALAARTRDQLRELFTDLPGPVPVPAHASALDTPDAVAAAAATGAARTPGVISPGVPPMVRVLVPLFMIFAVLAVLHGAPPFPLIPLMFILSRRPRRWNREARPWT